MFKNKSTDIENKNQQDRKQVEWTSQNVGQMNKENFQMSFLKK